MTAAVKCVVFGIDGGTLDILRPMAEAGYLPVLRSLMEQGASGELRSTIPPITAAAWTTFATGTNPGKHGLVDFVAPEAPAYNSRVLSASHRRRPTLWRLLGDAGLTAGVVGVPMTYPPEPHQGYLVSGMMTPASADRYTWPEGLGEELKRLYGPFPFHPGQGVMPSQTGRYLRAIEQDMERGAAWALHLLRARPTDFFMYVFAATDPLQHQFHDVIADGVRPEKIGSPQGLFAAIIGLYRLMDRQMGELLAAAGGDPLVLVMSDHGFGPLEGFFHVNIWLLKQGYLNISRGPRSRLKHWLFMRGLTPENIHLALLRVGVDLRRRVNKGSSYGRLRRFFLSFDDVDWPRTRAFSMGHVGQIYINAAGRFGQGIVRPGAELEALKRRLRDDLLALRHPAGGAPLIGQVFFREEIYEGDPDAPAPDILFLPAGLRIMSFGETAFASNRVVGPSLGHTGHHRMEGLLIARGPGVPGGTISGAGIQDLAPTILHHLGQPIPADMDGTVLTGLFRPQDLASRPPVIISGGEARGASQGGYTADEEESVRARLMDLGYIS